MKRRNCISSPCRSRSWTTSILYTGSGSFSNHFFSFLLKFLLRPQLFSTSGAESAIKSVKTPKKREISFEYCKKLAYFIYERNLKVVFLLDSETTMRIFDL